MRSFPIVSNGKKLPPWSTGRDSEDYERNVTTRTLLAPSQPQFQVAPWGRINLLCYIGKPKDKVRFFGFAYTVKKYKILKKYNLYLEKRNKYPSVFLLFCNMRLMNSLLSRSALTNPFPLCLLLLLLFLNPAFFLKLQLFMKGSRVRSLSIRWAARSMKRDMYEEPR